MESLHPAKTRAESPTIVQAPNAPRAGRGRHGLHEGGGRSGSSLVAGPHGDAGDRRNSDAATTASICGATLRSMRIDRRGRVIRPRPPMASSMPRRPRAGDRRAGSGSGESPIQRGPKVLPNASPCRPDNASLPLACWSAARWPWSRYSPALRAIPRQSWPTARIGRGRLCVRVCAAGPNPRSDTPRSRPSVRPRPGGDSDRTTDWLVLAAGGAVISFGSVQRLGEPHPPPAHYVIWPLLASFDRQIRPGGV